MNMPTMPSAICTISSWCEWYMNVPGYRSVNSYTYVSPGGMGRWLSPDTPSIPLGRMIPCQCTVVGSGRRLVT